MSIIRKLFKWHYEPVSPLTPEELLEIKIAFRTCSGDCPIAIVFRAMMNHIEWQDKHLKDAKNNYEK